MSDYTIAMYLRLSSEDSDLKKSGRAESNSITNQRNLIQDFIEHTPEFDGAGVVEFCDDGWSGKNFERPGVTAMLDKIKQGKIRCIIVKDISRFGRDYLTVGDYISRVFPFMNVRFIAINDGFDSSRPIDIDSLETSFKTLLYDLYSRQLSRNVRKAKRSRAQRGYFQASFAPFGYRKAPSDKHRLIIDPEAAGIVRRIFSMAANGQSATQIAKTLNDEAVLTPMQYKRTAGCPGTVWPCIHENNFWNQHEVRHIIHDEQYIGKNIYGKRERDAAGNSHTVKTERSDWIIVSNAHEGIVTKEEFDNAQAAIRDILPCKKSRQSKGKLKNKIRCGACGHIMTRSGRKNPGYYCVTPKICGKYDCSIDKVPENDIVNVLLETLHLQSAIGVEMREVWEERRLEAKKSIAVTVKKLAALKELYVRQDGVIKDLYESFVFGAISREEYLEKKKDAAKKRDDTAAKISDLKTNLENSSNNGILQDHFMDSFKQYAEVKELNGEMMIDALNTLSVYPDRKLEIIWNYEDVMKLFD